MIALLALLTLLTLFVTSSRVAAVALEATGMARDSAQFQARSALMGVGYTTSEAEDITTHPVRRRIVLFLMTFGNAGIVTGIAGFLLTFIEAEGPQTIRRSAILVGGVIAILAALHTKLANRLIEKGTQAAIRRYTSLDIVDYAALLRFDGDYAITELAARDGEWLVGRPLSALHLTHEGVVVLGIHRADGHFLGTPTGDTVIGHGDHVVAYGRTDVLRELASRPAATGDRIHDAVSTEQQKLMSEEH